MKKLLSLILSISAIFIFIGNVKAEECVDVSSPDPITFERNIAKKGTLMATYKWFEETEGVWSLKLDIDARGGHETWVTKYPNLWFFAKPVELPQTITENVCPIVEPEVTPEPTPVVEVPVIRSTTPAGAPTCQGITPKTVPWAYAKRVSTTSYVIFYVPTVFGGQVNIRFMEQGSTAWEHALLNYENIGVAPIDHLKNGIKYDFQIVNGNGCNQSAWSQVFKGV
jgi:hypothetical protein